MDAKIILSHLTPEQRRRYIGVDRRTWSRWLSGKHRIPHAVATLARILVYGELPFPGWEQWRVRRWGKRKEYTLHAPGGGDFFRDEIADIPHVLLDRSYLVSQVRDLQRRIAALDADETETLRASLRLIESRLLEKEPRKARAA